MKSKPITDATKAAILDAAWVLIADKGRVDVSQSEIASAAGVSRQTIFYAFGSRAGLLTAMARHKDERTDHVARLTAHARSAGDPVEAFLDYTAVWLDYLPEVYPVAVLLDAAALTDADAKAAIDDRLVHALLGGFQRLAGRVAEAGRLRPGVAPAEVAQEIWSATHVSTWWRLVVECGWTRERFVATRLALVQSHILERAGRPSSPD